MKLLVCFLRLFAACAAGGSFAVANSPSRALEKASRIQPYTGNPFYWQYQGRPVLLLGGSDDDNLFLWEEQALRAHLDLLASVGGNVVRNTMSSRNDGVPQSRNLQPFAQVKGRYDLERWNEDYWRQLELFLRLTSERRIFVQIELWDQHDLNPRAGGWNKSPWNPACNRNYTFENTTLKPAYGHPKSEAHGFFLTIPAINDDPVVRRYQQRFIDKMLAISLAFDHVLYCIDNEIHAPVPPEWGWYWAAHLRDRARAGGRAIEVTEMYWQPDLRHEQHRASLDRPDLFTFFEASQNSGNRFYAEDPAQANWDNLQYIRGELAKQRPRPINHTKIYGADSGPAWTGTTRDGVERFWRNIFGGSASSRFHRPSSGLGLTESAQIHIRSLRMLLERLDVFAGEPRNDLLSQREPNEAYCFANISRQYALYFPDGGSVEVDLSAVDGAVRLAWLDITASRWTEEHDAAGGAELTVAAPGSGHWAALISASSPPP